MTLTSMDLTPVTLEGGLARLEPLSMDHLDALVEAGADPELWRYTTSNCANREGMRDFVATALAWQADRIALPFTTIDQKSGKVVGSTRFANIVAEHKRVEIGWTWIARQWQRTGINTESKYLMLRHAFEHLGCNRVELKTNALNVKSRTAILRIGAQEEGTFRNHMINPDGTLRDTVYFSVIASEWPGVKARLEAMLRSY